MIIYLLPLLVLFVGLIFFRTSETYYKACIFYLMIFLCFGYMCGSDWRNYEMIYVELDTNNLPLYLIIMEPGYILITYCFKILGIDFWVYTVLIKCLLFLVSINIINKYCKSDFRYFALIFYLTWFAYYLYIDAPFRNSMAACIFLASLPLLLKRKLILYMLVSLVAFSVHTTAIFMIPLYFCYNIKISLSKCICIYVFVTILFINQQFILSILSSLFSWHPIIARKLVSYSGTVSKIFSLGYVYHLFFLALFLYSKKFIENKLPYGRMIFNFSFFNFLLFRMGLTFLMANRFMLYISVFYCIALASVWAILNYRSKIVYSSFILFLSLIMVTRYLSRDSRYVPYTNYLYYALFDSGLSFEYRSSYNDNNSPFEAMKTFEEIYEE